MQVHMYVAMNYIMAVAWTQILTATASTSGIYATVPLCFPLLIVNSSTLDETMCDAHVIKNALMVIY